VRVTAARFRTLVGNGSGTPSKYRNKKTMGFDADGSPIKLDSKREAKRWAQLQLMANRGEIIELQRQVPYTFYSQAHPDHFVMGPPSKKTGRRVKVKYIADFVYRWAPGHQGSECGWIVEDVKGMRTDAYRLKWALMDFFYGIQVKEV
jgi:hypothetical protein